MNVCEKLSRMLTNYIKDTLPDKSETELEEINYGLSCLLLSISKIFVILLIAYFLNVFKYTLTAFISFALVRNFASGIHAESSIICLIVSLSLFLGITYVSMLIQPNLIMIAVLFIISFILLYRYSPADTEKRPLTNAKLRKRLKIYSLAACTLLYIIATTLFVKSANYVYVNLIIIPVLAESFLITPFIYKIMGRRYRNYENFV